MLTLSTRGRASTQDRAGALVWIDAEAAVIVRWRDGRPTIERHASDVPAHHHGTEHVRYDPLTRHGGGGGWEAAEERRRIEHLDRFVAEIVGNLQADDDLVIVGQGSVHERLGAAIRAQDAQRRRVRPVDVRTSERRSDRQLVAQLRSHLCAGPRRRRARS